MLVPAFCSLISEWGTVTLVVVDEREEEGVTFLVLEVEGGDS